MGGESSREARPMNFAWMRHLITTARRFGTKIFVKQLGEVWASEEKKLKLVQIKGKHGTEVETLPEDLRIQEWPAPRRRPEIVFLPVRRGSIDYYDLGRPEISFEGQDGGP